MRRQHIWTDPATGEQYDADYYTYIIVPNPTTPTSGISGTINAGTQALASVNIEQDSWFEWLYTTSQSNNAAVDNGGDQNSIFSMLSNMTIQITDTAAGRNLFNEPLPIGTVSGTGLFPYVLPFPRRFKPTTTIIAVFNNYDTAINNNRIQLNLVGRKIYVNRGQREPSRFNAWRNNEGRMLAEDYFCYHFGFGNSVAGASLVSQQLIEGDSDFECRLLTGQTNQALNTGLAVSIGDNQLFQIKDGGSQRNLSSAFEGGKLAFGQSGLPLILPVPRIFLAKTTVQISYNNISAGATFPQTDVVLHGRKIFEFES